MSRAWDGRRYVGERYESEPRTSGRRATELDQQERDELAAEAERRIAQARARATTRGRQA